MNKTLAQLLHQRLIVQAKRMLLSSEQTIKEIAFDLNFEDHAYFRRFF
jgi:AraC-like DNA-binding protein